MKGEFPDRLKLLQRIFIIIPLIVIVRLFMVQIVQHDFYREKSQEQRTRLLLPAAHRGDIVDRNGRILATMVDAKSIFVDPRAIQNAPDVSKRLAEILHIPSGKILKQIENRKSFVWIARRIRGPLVEQVENLKYPGISFMTEQKRIYPHGRLASALVGFVGLDNEGLSGIELAMDEELRGKSGRIIFEGDPSGRQIAMGQSHSIERPERGQDVVLSIDLFIQHVTERALQEIANQYHPQGISAIVLNVQTGEILALANYPDFDPNQYSKSSPERWKIRPLTDLYEPGSTFKVITTAAGVEEGVVNKDTKLVFSDTIQVGGKTIGNSHPIRNLPHLYSVTDMLCQSVNTGAVQVGLKLGKDRFYKNIRSFGFGERLLDSFPGEGRGILNPPESWSAPDIGMLAFGQSIAVTPLQMVHAYASLGNGGTRMRPMLVKRMEQRDGSQVRSFTDHPIGQSVSPETSRQLLEMMEQVVLRGSGRHAKIPGYRVGGKTGTAQKVQNGRYLKGRYVASFIGMVPISEPRLAIFIAADEPKGSIWGETVAAPAVGKIAKAALSYLDIPPDNIASPE